MLAVVRAQAQATPESAEQEQARRHDQDAVEAAIDAFILLRIGSCGLKSENHDAQARQFNRSGYVVAGRGRLCSLLDRQGPIPDVPVSVRAGASVAPVARDNAARRAHATARSERIGVAGRGRLCSLLDRQAPIPVSRGDTGFLLIYVDGAGSILSTDYPQEEKALSDCS
jgi:hypothetical protein